MRKKTNLPLLLIFLIGLGILLYPTVSDRWNSYRAKKLEQTYRKAVQNEAKEDTARMLQAAEAYNGQLQKEKVPDAFSVREGIRDEAYEALLNLTGDGIMGFVEIPDISISIPIYHYTTKEVLEKGAGHLFGSSLPVGGSSTHTVISAHRGLPSAKLFTDLPLLKTGDVFYFHILDRTLAYKIDQIQTVAPEQVSSLRIQEGEDLATLVTCTPYGVNTRRLLVRGHRVPFREKEYESDRAKEGRKDPNLLLGQILSALGGLLLAGILVGGWNYRKQRKQKKK